MTGILPNGTHMVTQAIDYKDIYDYWSKDVLSKLPSAGSSRVVKSLFVELRFGSFTTFLTLGP